VAEHCFGAASQDRTHPSTAPCQLGSSHGIDAAPHPMEATIRNPALDRGAIEPELEQLCSSDDPVLFLR
jgi:hypothetical protein